MPSHRPGAFPAPRGLPVPAIPVLALALLLAVPVSARAQTPRLCVQAERFLVETIGMIAVSEPDTIDDWRTQAMVPGCRVTAAAGSRQANTEIVRAFYQVLDESDWVRTPDPRDAPAEASMRYRRDGADCLFNFYGQSMALNTEAELVVSDAVHLGPGEKLYNFLVLCTPAAPAAPRG